MLILFKVNIIYLLYVQDESQHFETKETSNKNKPNKNEKSD